MARTNSEIVERIKASKSFFGFDKEVLIGYLPFEIAKPWLVETATADQWKQDTGDDASITAHMKDYMEFAWEKAIDMRGLSANRSIEKMGAWLWLLGDQELLDFLGREENYAPYGKPILRAISEKYGFPIPATA